jgi:hypothetical protein
MCVHLQVRLSPAQAEWVIGLGVRPSVEERMRFHTNGERDAWFSAYKDKVYDFRAKHKSTNAPGDMLEFLAAFDEFPAPTHDNLVLIGDCWAPLNRHCKCKFYVAKPLVRPHHSPLQPVLKLKPKELSYMHWPLQPLFSCRSLSLD